MATATVIVESRHLDTDFRVRDGYQVPTPDDANQERARLLDLVRGLHPGAPIVRTQTAPPPSSTETI